MKRISIILFVAVFMLLSCAGCISEEEKMEEKFKLKLHNEVVEVEGLKKDYEIILIADSHVSLADERDPVAIEDKAISRYNMFRDADANGADKTFNEMIEYTKAAGPDLLVLGGDITDSAMYASIEKISENVDALPFPYIYSMGNHDFEYGKEYYSEASFSQYLPRFKDVSATNDGYQIKEFDEFIVFAADDNNNKFSAKALEAFKTVANGEKQVIFVSHMPIEPQTGDTTLWDKTIEVWQPSATGNSRVLLGNNSCVPDSVTAEMINLILAEDSSVVLVLSGHIHFFHRDMLNDKVVQIVTGAGYEREIVHITLTASST